jgi:hypothetical protein
MKFRNAIFVVSNERLCPIYNIGEEFIVNDGTLTVPEAKGVCLILALEIVKIVSTEKSFERFSPQGVRKVKYDCGGCEGLINFEYKKEKEFSTLQMKLLAEAEQKRKTRHLDDFADLLRHLEIFKPLSDKNLRDLSALLQLKEFAAKQVILKEGEEGSNLYILLSGKVAVVDENEAVLLEILEGQVIGEMSLLSGEPVTKTVIAQDASRLAMLSNKDFRHVLKKYPELNVLFYRLLVERVAKSGEPGKEDVASGMSGELSYISAVDLFQLINASQKSGKIELWLDDGKAIVLFNEGELVGAKYRKFKGKNAVFALLGKNKGRFAYTSGLSEAASKLPVLGSFMALVMEGLQKIDEEDAGG